MLKMLSALLAAFLLGGCASTGYKVADTQSALEPQEPWQSVVLWDVDIRKERSFAVVRIPLPNPLPAVWRWDMNDHHRTYAVGKDERVLRRSVWRAVVFEGTDPVPTRTYNAVSNPGRTAMFVLVPGGEERVNGLLRQNMILVSADACFVQTTKRDIVPLTEFGTLPDEFFRNHPSPVAQDMIHIMDESTEAGRRFLTDFRNQFPKLVSGTHSARSDVALVAQLTAEAGLSDRFISKGSAPVGVSMFVGGPVNPITAIGMLVRNREVFAGGVCKDAHEELGLKPETVSWQGE
jgi:hypothetical protein